MKNLIYKLLLLCLIPLGSCQSDSLNNAARQISTVSACCENLSVLRTSSSVAMSSEDKKSSDEWKANPASYLASFTWDSKMMFW